MAISNFGKLWLLMEKNFLLQWRHKIRTLLCILVPVIVASLIVVLRNSIDPLYRGSGNYGRNFQVLELWNSAIQSDTNEWKIAYSPNTPLTASIVQDAIDRIMEFNNDRAFFEPVSLSIQPYANSSALDSIYHDASNVNRIFAGVQFPDTLTGQNTLPDNVEFSLRFPMRRRLRSIGRETSWRTELSFPLAFTPGPRERWSIYGSAPGYERECFLALQHAVSLAIIQTKNGSTDLLEDLDIRMRAFPYAEYFFDYFHEIFPVMLMLLFLIGFSFQGVNIVKSIVEEKEKQLKEAMKIMGLSTWHHWTAWFLNQYILIVISTLLIIIVFKVPVLTLKYDNGVVMRTYPLLEPIETSLLIVFFFLYGAALCTFSFMISTFFDSESRVSTASKIIWLMSFLPSALVNTPGAAPTLAEQILVSLLFNSAMSVGFTQISTYGVNSMVLTWSNMFSPLTVDNTFTFGHVMIILLAMTIVHMLIALYVEKVFPGTYGIPQPWYFLFTKDFWGLSKHNKINISGLLAKIFAIFANSPPEDVIQRNIGRGKEIKEKQNPVKYEGVISESDPVGMNVGVDIINLTKKYHDEKVVDNINLKIYEDQITVLLGHNGAGKSTTLSMIIGMITPTSGTAILGGYDIQTDTKAARDSLGFCPQHSILFSGLTVEEHIKFYSRLKGLSRSAVREETERFIQLLGLIEKRHSLPSSLSGGQKRKLSVGIALCGDSKFVFLDEPSSGLDPSARRSLWDILEKEKIGRTIIITTHFMDEAEILGDRVGIMLSGRMKCIGSPFFLKQQYKLGYTLSIVKDSPCNIHGITKLLDKYVPGLKPPVDIGSELTYMLPHGSSRQFETLLGELENNQNTLGFHSYGLSASALEEVFMKVNDDTQVFRADVESNGHNGLMAESYGSYTVGAYTVTGKKLLMNHIKATLLKRLLTTRRSWLHPIIQTAVPFIIILSSIFTNINLLTPEAASLVPRTLSLENGFIRTNTLLTSVLNLSQPIQSIMNEYKNSFSKSDATLLTDWGNVDMATMYLQEIPNDMRAMRFENMIGVSFEVSNQQNQLNAWYSDFSYHDIAISLSVLDNAILRSVSPTSSLTVTNHPLWVSEDNVANLLVREVIENSLNLVNIVYAVGFASSYFIMVYVKERESRAKLLQKASGLSSLVMWGCAFVHDYIMYIIITIFLIIALVLAQTPGYANATDIALSWFLLLVYGISALPVVYLMAYLFKSPSRGFIMMFLINLLAGFIYITFDILRQFGTSDNIDDIADGMEYVLYLFPFYAYTASVWNMASIYTNNTLCYTICNNLPITIECTAANLRALGVDVRCLEDIPHFGWQNPGISRSLLYMAIMSVVLFALLMVFEYRLIPVAAFCKPKLIERPPRFMDDDVAGEKQRVETILQNPDLLDNLISRTLKKQYGKNLAVNNVSFAIGSGECFGLLGTNGAGKTSTFKMLTGDLQITAGEAWVHGYSVNNDVKNVYKYIGYCPQFDGLFESLSGRENLTIYCWLKGIPIISAQYIIEAISHKLGFYRYLDKVVSKYSGGNKRKLSTAIALIGESPIIFLDEPTTGMDPAAKRQLWQVILEQVRVGRSVVLTSHSMEECQALCSRLTIMVDGEFRCIGSPQHLKNKFSQGCTITIQLAREDNISRYKEENQLAEIENYLRTNFGNLKIKEITTSLYTYNIRNQTVQWSKLFGILERAKEKQIIEDYSINQTTLEQVFLQFTNKSVT